MTNLMATIAKVTIKCVNFRPMSAAMQFCSQAATVYKLKFESTSGEQNTF